MPLESLTWSYNVTANWVTGKVPILTSQIVVSGQPAVVNTPYPFSAVTKQAAINLPQWIATISTTMINTVTRKTM